MSSSTILESPSQADNRVRIFEAAEALFGRHGFSATSLRAITAEAEVNLASVNYYFGSKDQLIVEVLSRAIRPLNEQRLALLAIARQSHPSSPIPLPEILNAILRPCLEIAFDPARQSTFRLLGRSLSEEGNFIQQVIEKEWTPMIGRFMEVLRETLPTVPESEIYWRLHFTVGALIHLSCHHRKLDMLSNGRCQAEIESSLSRLIDYASAGFQAAAHPTQP